MTVTFERRADEALKEARRWREAAAKAPYRTHRRKVAFWWAKRLEQEADGYHALAKGADQ